MSDSSDRSEPADRGAVEGQAVLEHILVEDVNRNCEVLHGAGQVTEADVDILDVLVLASLKISSGVFSDTECSFAWLSAG